MRLMSRRAVPVMLCLAMALGGEGKARAQPTGAVLGKVQVEVEVAPGLHKYLANPQAGVTLSQVTGQAVQQFKDLLTSDADLRPWSFRESYSPERLVFAVTEVLPGHYQLSVTLKNRYGDNHTVIKTEWCEPGTREVKCVKEKDRLLYQISRTNVIVDEFLRKYGASLTKVVRESLAKKAPIADLELWRKRRGLDAITPLSWNSFSYLATGTPPQNPYLWCASEEEGITSLEVYGSWASKPFELKGSRGARKGREVLKLKATGSRKDDEQKNYMAFEGGERGFCLDGYNRPEIFLASRWKRAEGGGEVER